MRKEIQKVGLLVLLAMSAMVSGFAQDDAQFTFFPWVTSYYNAGGIGEQHNTLCFTADYSNKYLGWSDLPSTAITTDTAKHTAPQDFLFSIESYLRKLHGSLGVTLVRDQLGYYKNTGVKIGYAYKLRVGGGHLGIGAQVSLYNQKIDASGFNPTQEGDPTLQGLSESTLDLDFSFGVMYKSDQWYAGIGWNQITAAFDTSQAMIRLSGNRGSHRTSQLYVHGGYDWVVPFNPNWEILPQALVKTDFKTFQWEILALARYNGVYWGGIGYRFQDAVSLAFGARPFYNSSNIYLKGLDVGVSYGFTANSLGYKKNRSFGDVEVVVRYCFDIYKPEVFSGYGNSRYIYKNRY
ncbi:MAG: PorP/SprF family type IX secretion system membrane protein [Bacteroidales bacterium]|nr:PorP/SprF family type IX secretion system membrane protein [Bacteroidales bacterium]